MIEELACAKTNLFLEVPRKREDGFHELDTIFVELEVADRLTIEPLDEARLELLIEGDETLSAGPDNLVVRAYESLRGGHDLGARIRLEKRIPQGGGLGGGSSDAAAALRGLDALWGLATPKEELERIAAELGSDVAFFLEGGLQRGLGRGELLSPLPPLPRELDLVLVFPPFGCPTPAVYRALAPHLPQAPREPKALLEALAEGEVERIGPELFNRLALPAEDLFPELAELRTQLEAHPLARSLLLSGSGSTLIVLVDDARAGQELCEELELPALVTRTRSSR